MYSNNSINTNLSGLCCNEEKKAKKRVVYASSNLKKSYFINYGQYFQGRCQTYEQKLWFNTYNILPNNPVQTFYSIL